MNRLHLNYLSFFFVSLVLTEGAPAAPLTASITINTSSSFRDEGTSISFSASKSGGTSPFKYFWKFGDAGDNEAWTEKSVNPTHTYKDDGYYTVMLKVTDSSSSTQTALADPVVINIKNVSPSGSITGAPASSPEAVEIKLSSSITDAGSADRPDLTRTWSVTGGPFTITGSSGTTGASFRFIPEDSGTYIVRLTIDDQDGGVTTLNQTIPIINLPPNANHGGPYVGIRGAAVDFVGTATDPSPVDATSLAVTWDFGDGGTGSGFSPRYTYANVGAYTVTMTARDKDGSNVSSQTAIEIHATASYLDQRGLFSLSAFDGSLSPRAVANANVDGLAIRASWDRIEPADDHYDWAYLDDCFAQAAAAGKMVSLSIRAGLYTPSWVYAAGAPEFHFNDGSEHVRIPVPWNSVFLAEWKELIAALGTRYSSRAVLAHVKITGIQSTSAETGLPNEPEYLDDWVNVGYTRKKVKDAWKQIANAFAVAFPNQKIALIFKPKDFPTINDQGVIFTNTSGGDSVLPNQLIDIGVGIQSHGDPVVFPPAQFIAQNNALSTTYVAEQVTAVEDRVDTGYQMLWFVTEDTTYRLNKGNSIAPGKSLRNAADLGIEGDPNRASGAKYLEIYQVDIDNGKLKTVISEIRTGHGMHPGLFDN